MDSVLGACIALTALSVIISTNALLAARRAERESLRFLEWKANIVSIQPAPAPKPGPFPDSIQCGSTPVTQGNLYLKGGSITIETQATTRDLDDLYKRIQKLQDNSPLRGD